MSIWKRTLGVLLSAGMLAGAMAFTASAEEVKNAVSNPSFEEDITTEWATGYAESQGKFMATDEQAHTGERSLKVYDRQMPDSWWLTAYQNDFTIPAKTEITLSAWVKLEEGAGDKIMRLAIYNDQGADIVSMSASGPIEAICNDQEWTLIKGTYRAPVEVTNVRVGVHYYPDVSDAAEYWGGAFYVDDVSVTGGATTTQPGVKQDVPTEEEAPPTTTTEAPTTTTEVSTTTTSSTTRATTTTTAATTAGDTVSEAEEPAGGFPLVPVIVVAVVVVVAAAGVGVYFFIRKKKGDGNTPQ